MAGVGSTRPPLTARTLKRYLPGLSFSFFGDLQLLNFGFGVFLPFLAGFLTSAHSNVAPAVVELKRNLTEARLPLVLTFFFGPLSIFVSGCRLGLFAAARV